MTDQFTIVGAATGEQVIATGAPSGLFPSGPSAYVFDKSGKLVDWSRDIGDDPAFDGLWQAQRSIGSPRILRSDQLASWLINSGSASRPK